MAYNLGRASRIDDGLSFKDILGIFSEEVATPVGQAADKGTVVLYKPASGSAQVLQNRNGISTDWDILAPINPVLQNTGIPRYNVSKDRLETDSELQYALGTLQIDSTTIAQFAMDTGINQDAQIVFQHNGGAKWRFGNDATDSDKFKIERAGAALGTENNFVIDQTNGNIGMGRVPSGALPRRLEIQGSVDVYSRTASDPAALLFYPTVTKYGSIGIAGGYFENLRIGGAEGKKIRFNVASTDIDIEFNGDQLYIDQGKNNIGVGTALPDVSAKLNVVGGNILIDNNTYFEARETGGTIRTLMGINTSNQIILGASPAASITAMRFRTGGTISNATVHWDDTKQLFNAGANNIDFIINKDTASEAYKYDAGLDTHTWSGDGSFANNLIISGNLTVTGDYFKTPVEQVEISDNLILINAGQTGSGVTAGYAGAEIDRGELAPYRWGFNEVNDSFEVGIYYEVATGTKSGTFTLHEEVIQAVTNAKGYVFAQTAGSISIKATTGQFTTSANTITGQTSGETVSSPVMAITDQLQPMATREDTPYHVGDNQGIFFWDSANARMETSSEFYWDGVGKIINVASTGNPKLQINSSNGQASVILDSGLGDDSNVIFKENGATKWYMGNDGDDLDNFKIDNGVLGASNHFVISDLGNVIIGHNSATSKLSVKGKIGIIDPNNNEFKVIYVPDQDAGAYQHSLFFGNGGSSLAHTTAVEGQYNLGVGFNSLLSVSTGFNNIGIGHGAVDSLTTAANVVAIGRSAGSDLTTQGSIVLIGSFAGSKLVNSSAVFVGQLAGQYATTGSNTILGTSAGIGVSGTISVGTRVTIVGHNTGRYISTDDVVAIGTKAAEGTTAPLTIGQRSTVVGNYAGQIATGANLTALGYEAGYQAAGDNGVFLGYRAGYYETGVGKLFIDNQQRTDEATARTEAIIYGEFDSVPANQLLRFNSNVEMQGDTFRKLSLYVNTTTIPSGLTLGELNFGGIDSDATNLEGAKIQVQTEGSWTVSNHPTRMLFYTSTTGGLVERMRINSAGRVGIGVIPSQWKLTVGSDDDTDVVGIYHDNTNAYVKWDDGSLFLETDEGTDSNTVIGVRGKGTGFGQLRMYDEDNAEYTEMQTNGGNGMLRVVGATTVSLRLQPDGKIPIKLFDTAAAGDTPELQIYGYRTADALRSLQIGVGVDAADTASFDGLSSYYFNGKIGIGISSPLAPLHIVNNQAGDYKASFIIQDIETDAQPKRGRIGVKHHTNSEQPFYALFMESLSLSSNRLSVGGGSGLGNAATEIRFMTALNATTTTGTERAKISSYGEFSIFGNLKINNTNTVVDGDYTILDDDGYSDIDYDTGASDRACLLPTLAANIGRIMWISKINDDAGKVTISCEGADTFLDGSTSLDLFVKGETLAIKGSALGWKVF